MYETVGRSTAWLPAWKPTFEAKEWIKRRLYDTPDTHFDCAAAMQKNKFSESIKNHRKSSAWRGSASVRKSKRCKKSSPRDYKASISNHKVNQASC